MLVNLCLLPYYFLWVKYLWVVSPKELVTCPGSDDMTTWITFSRPQSIEVREKQQVLKSDGWIDLSKLWPLDCSLFCFVFGVRLYLEVVIPKLKKPLGCQAETSYTKNQPRFRVSFSWRPSIWESSTKPPPPNQCVSPFTLYDCVLGGVNHNLSRWRVTTQLWLPLKVRNNDKMIMITLRMMQTDLFVCLLNLAFSYNVYMKAGVPKIHPLNFFFEVL